MRARLIVMLCATLLTGVAVGGSGDGSSRSAKEEIALGAKAARRGYWQEALYRFERADALKPEDPGIQNNLAVALEAVGRYEEAKALYERALKAAPGDRDLRRNKKSFDEFYTTYVAPPEPGAATGKGEAKDETAKP